MKPLLTITLTLILLIAWTTAIPSEMDQFQVTEERLYFPKLPEPSYIDRRLQDMQLASKEPEDRRRDVQPTSREQRDRGMVFVATAYTHVATPGEPDINGTGDGLTAINTPVREGIVAVDPKVIPLKSQVYIESDFPGVTGWYRAEDIGSSIKGARVDIFMEDLETALRFGKQEVRVRIIDKSIF